MKEFDAIFKEFTPVVYHFLLSLCGNESLAEELTSETFYQAAKAAQQICQSGYLGKNCC